METRLNWIRLVIKQKQLLDRIEKLKHDADSLNILNNENIQNEVLEALVELYKLRDELAIFNLLKFENNNDINKRKTVEIRNPLVAMIGIGEYSLFNILTKKI